MYYLIYITIKYIDYYQVLNNYQIPIEFAQFNLFSYKIKIKMPTMRKKMSAGRKSLKLRNTSKNLSVNSLAKQVALLRNEGRSAFQKQVAEGSSVGKLAKQVELLRSEGRSAFQKQVAEKRKMQQLIDSTIKLANLSISNLSKMNSRKQKC